MNSKSRMLFTFIKEVDQILGKLYETTPDGHPITPGDQAWMDTRDRLMKVKVGSETQFTYPINWTLSEQLIMDELTSREGAHEIHKQIEKDYNGR